MSISVGCLAVLGFFGGIGIFISLSPFQVAESGSHDGLTEFFGVVENALE